MNNIKGLYILNFVFLDIKRDEKIPDGIVSDIPWVTSPCISSLMQNFWQSFRFQRDLLFTNIFLKVN